MVSKRTTDLVRLQQVYDVLLKGTINVPGWDKLVGLSVVGDASDEIKRLREDVECYQALRDGVMTRIDDLEARLEEARKRCRKWCPRSDELFYEQMRVKYPWLEDK